MAGSGILGEATNVATGPSTVTDYVEHVTDRPLRTLYDEIVVPTSSTSPPFALTVVGELLLTGREPGG